MLGKCVVFAGMSVLALSRLSFGAAQQSVVTDRLLDSENLVLPWVIGVGILALTLIVGFKNPGRTHMD